MCVCVCACVIENSYLFSMNGQLIWCEFTSPVNGSNAENDVPYKSREWTQTISNGK